MNECNDKKDSTAIGMLTNLENMKSANGVLSIGSDLYVLTDAA